MTVYRLICIVDSLAREVESNSTLDSSPEYLHIHVLDSKYLKPIDEFIQNLSGDDLDNSLYQWGTNLEKIAHTRSAKVSAEEIKKYGQIGIGSAARGEGEQSGNFVGGGEAFLFNSQNFRIIKGNGVFESNDDQKYWTFQVADFNGAQRISDFRNIQVNGRENLMKILIEKSDGMPLIATFDAEFEGEFFARSNGIFPEEVDLVERSNESLFLKEINGGHLVGGSLNDGDIASLELEFSHEKSSSIDFNFLIVSDIVLKPIHEVKIAKKNGDFRKPRTDIEVNDAAQLIQKFWKNR